MKFLNHFLKFDSEFFRDKKLSVKRSYFDNEKNLVKLTCLICEDNTDYGVEGDNINLWEELYIRVYVSTPREAKPFLFDKGFVFNLLDIFDSDVSYFSWRPDGGAEKFFFNVKPIKKLPKI